MSGKYPECQTCYFNNRSPEICEDCESASEYEGRDSSPDSGEVERLKRITFVPRHQEIVRDIEDGFPDWWKL